MSKDSGDFDRDILDIIPERYDDDADSHQARAGHRTRTFITMGLAVAAVGGIVAAGLHFIGSKPMGGPGIPVIKADDRPIKTRPDDRGGMQVPNQDKLVYGRIGAGEGDARVERLLPSAEQPVVPPQIPVQPDKARPAAATEILRPPAPGPAPSKTEPPAPKAAPQMPVTAQPLAEPSVPAEPAASTYQPIEGRIPAPVAVQKPEVQKPEIQKTEVQKSEVPAQVAALPAMAPAPPSGDWLIQLGALRAQDLAEREWNRIRTANNDLLGALKPTIVRVDLGDKGTFWRLRAGPLSEQAAKQLCGQLKERNQGCIIAR